MSRDTDFDQRKADELAQRRLKRRTDHGAPGDESEGDEEEIKFTWSDTFAMIIAAYQVLLPMLLVMIGALVLVYLAFIWIFS